MYGLLSAAIGVDFSAFVDNLKNIFANFYWTDAVDIVILGLLFYFVLSFFKSRKAGTLVVGIFLCIALYAIAIIFNLTGVQYILSGVFQIGALAIIIIFQPEIRELLEAIGSGSIKGIRGFGESANNKQAQYKAIDNICKAVYVMAAEKTGALIVIERTTQLEEIIHTGITINADVSDYLIRNIFFNKAPLHDGAMVIEGNRIKAAACILPLPKHTYVENELGTRHRAAVGLSEISDAVIIVVSEETGTISVAKESELKRDFTEDSLRKYLVKELFRDKHNQENN
nr:TIGR00159 family protein [Oscillospiraceae bacterium]